MLGKTAEGNDCGPITATHFVPRLESDAFQKMLRSSGDVRYLRALSNILPGL